MYIYTHILYICTYMYIPINISVPGKEKGQAEMEKNLHNVRMTTEKKVTKTILPEIMIKKKSYRKM